LAYNADVKQVIKTQTSLQKAKHEQVTKVFDGQ
jgi:hypothetical protein